MKNLSMKITFISQIGCSSSRTPPVVRGHRPLWGGGFRPPSATLTTLVVRVRVRDGRIRGALPLGSQRPHATPTIPRSVPPWDELSVCAFTLHRPCR